MSDIADLLRQGSTNLWLFVPSAIALGALHGLEPGHSKTMMAGFIIAIRGTIGQAVLLGIAATLSHTAVVWAVALAGMHFGDQWNAETTEPYFQAISGVIIAGVALWVLFRTWRQNNPAPHRHHGHDHSHAAEHAYAHGHDDKAMDDHDRAHAEDIKRKFGSGHATNGQIIMFGLTGGLLPCPAAITVLLLCLQLKEFTLGIALVFCFSIGLALTLVLAGVAAAYSVRHAAKRIPQFENWARRAPYVSGTLILLVGCYIGFEGLSVLMRD